MIAAIKPLSAGTKLCGQARTISVMVGDNSCIHAALSTVRQGEVLTIDGGGAVDIALWGGIMTRVAMARGVQGIVLDGMVRDSAEIRATGFPCFARDAIPRGPHKGFGGTLDAVTSVGGVAVTPGDIILGDDDGVVVVPLSAAAEILRAAKDLIAREQNRLTAVLGASSRS